MAYIHKSPDTGIFSARVKGLKNQKNKEKMITLRTSDQNIAKKRLMIVKSKEPLIKDRFHSRAEIHSMFDWLDESDLSARDYEHQDIPNYSFVYIISAKNTNYYKIGKSDIVENRLREIQTSCMFDLEIIYKYKFYEKYVYKVEKSIQKSLSFYQTPSKNEWFKLRKSELLSVSKILTQYLAIYSKDGNNI